MLPLSSNGAQGACITTDRRQTLRSVSETSGGFLTIKEKGRWKDRSMAMPLNMAKWVGEVLGSSTSKRDRSVVRRRFGRLEGWIKSRSNSKGRFLELGISGNGSVSVIFVPGRRVEEPWLDFREALWRVAVPRVVDCGFARNLRSGLLVRSYKDVAVGRNGRSPTVVSEEATAAAAAGPRVSFSSAQGTNVGAREGAWGTSHEETIRVAQQVASEVARQVAREVAREYERVTAIETEKLMVVMRELTRALTEGFSKGFGLHNALHLGVPIESDVGGLVAVSDARDREGGDHQKGKSTGSDFDMVEDEGKGSDPVGYGSDIGWLADEGGDKDFDGETKVGSDEDSDGFDSLDGECLNGGDLLLDQLRESYDLETQMEGLEDMSHLFQEETRGQQIEESLTVQPQTEKEVVVEDNPSENNSGGTVDILSIPDSCQEALCTADEEESLTVAVDASQNSSPVGLVRDPLDGATLGSKEADDRARIALAEIGCYLTHPTKKAPVTPLQVFSRRNKSSREVERLKTSVNYDKGLKGGLRKGFLG